MIRKTVDRYIQEVRQSVRGIFLPRFRPGLLHLVLFSVVLCFLCGNPLRGVGAAGRRVPDFKPVLSFDSAAASWAGRADGATPASRALLSVDYTAASWIGARGDVAAGPGLFQDTGFDPGIRDRAEAGISVTSGISMTSGISGTSGLVFQEISSDFLNKAGFSYDLEDLVETGDKDLPDPGREPAISQFILLILDKLTLQDLLGAAGPELTALLHKSAVALMNVNTATTPGTESGYLTLGAGARLAGNWTVRQAFNQDEDLPAPGGVGALYRRHTGQTAVPAGEVLHPYCGALQRLNEQRPYPVFIGALGEALRAGNLGAAVLGNADSDTPGRQAVAIAMDRAGAVAYGDVGPALLREREDFPFGCASDAEAYLKAFTARQQQAALLVVEWGDTGRLDNYLDHLPAGRRDELLRASLQELDHFLLGLRPYLHADTGLLIVTPSPPQAAYAGGQRLTPVIFYRPGAAGGGLLTTPTTRRPGLITNLDVAPSILHALGLEAPTFFLGAPWQVVPAAEHLPRLLSLSTEIARVNNQRSAVIKGYILAQIILLLGGLVGLLCRFKPAGILRPGIIALLFFPPALLLVPAWPFYPAASPGVNLLAILGLTLFLTVAACFFFRGLPALFAFTGLLVFSLLTVDLCRGAYLNSRSFLGYDPVGGSRFYGLGNEYMGLLIGALILGFSALYSLLEEKTVQGVKAGGGEGDALPPAGEKDFAGEEPNSSPSGENGFAGDPLSVFPPDKSSVAGEFPGSQPDSSGEGYAFPSNLPYKPSPTPPPDRGATVQIGLVLLTWLFLFISFFVLYLLASPRYGANFGGAITAGVALSVTFARMLALLQQKGIALIPFSAKRGFLPDRLTCLFPAGKNCLRSRWNHLFPAGRGLPRHPLSFLFSGRRGFLCRGNGEKSGRGPVLFPLSQKILIWAVFGLITAALLYYLNTPHANTAVSHVGRTLELVRSHGLQELLNVARRKMEMNLKLMRYSLWSRVLLVFIFLISLLYYYPVGLMRQIFQENPGFKLAFGGIIAGSLTAFLVNDSGVVAAATTMLYGALPLFLLCWQKVFP